VWWKNHAAKVLKELDASFCSRAEKALAAVTLGAPMGTAYLSALYGRPLPSRIQSHLRQASDGLRSGTVIYHHCDILTLADYIAAARNGTDDIALAALLKDSYGGHSVTAKSLADLVALKGNLLKGHPIGNQGVARIQMFLDDVIAPALHPSVLALWSWADVIMVALIVTTSILWEHRLARLYPDNDAFTPSLLSKIGRHVMNAHRITDPNKAIYDMDPLMTLTCLQLGFATLLHF
jgi:hypothetical protein